MALKEAEILTVRIGARLSFPCKTYLDRIENSDKEINSYITALRKRADAKKAQEVIDSGNSGAFIGLPISIEDNICTLGITRQPVRHITMTSFLRITQR